MKNFKRKESLKETGITLVALVVTIIVLLILAGVTLTLALSNNGVMDRAQYASNTWANATKDEETAMGQFASDVDTLTEGFINREGTPGGGSGGTGGSGGGSTGPVIKDSTGTPIDLANIASYYGHDVTYNEKTYQLFYYDATGKYGDAGRIWLQYKDYVSGVALSGHYETTGILTDNANSKIWEVNPDLKTKYQANIRAIAESSLNNNIKGVAYLCNTANWNEAYVGTAGVNAGAYAIGGVSAEMFCDSYNAARGKTSTDADYFDAKAFNKNSTYGYWYKPNGQTNAQYYEGDYGSYTNYSTYPISTDYGTMYRISGSYYQWLSSPSSGGTNLVCAVGGNRGTLNYDNTANTFGVRPAVSLPSSIQIQLTN